MEVEVKAPCPDPDGFRRKVMEMEGVFQGRYHQDDVYYAHPSRDFALSDEALRIRSQKGVVQMHYKGPKVDRITKTREELGLFIQDQEIMGRILDRLGFHPVMTVSKEREMYLLRGIEICIDKVDGLSTYVELESNGDDVDEERRKILALMSELGLQGSERRSYLELLLEGRDV